MRKIEMMMSKGSRSSEERDWCDLPIDVFVLIKSLLYPNEWDNFDHVWQSIPNPPFPIPTKFPNSQWLVDFPQNHDIFHFYHPMNKRRYDTFWMKFPELYGSIIRCSKYGWLLMSRDLRSLFFLNPFTRDKIELPPLPINLQVKGISFSSSPTSSDCVVFCIDDSHRYDADVIFIRRGQNTWTLASFRDDDHHFKPSYSNPVFHKQVFYCLTSDGKLGVLDPNKRTTRTEDEEQEQVDIDLNWKILGKPISPIESYLIYECFLMESEGELLSVFIGNKGKCIDVFSLNRRKLVWEEVNSLGSRVLFLSHTGSLSVNSIMRGMENKIYLSKLHRKYRNGVFYSLESGRYNTFQRSDWSSKDFNRLEERLNCTWIEPIQVGEQRPSSEQLDWLWQDQEH